MKYFILLLLLSGCDYQPKSDPQSLYNEEFKWTITIPEDFQLVNATDWAKIQNKGANAIEDTFGEEVENQAKLIFVFKNAEHNYLEANQQPFDEAIDGDYLDSFRNVNEIIHETFRTQLPNAEMQTHESEESISGLQFHTNKTILKFANGKVLHMLMFSRLFDKQEFTVNIMYIDQDQGKKMLDAWKNSQFD